MAREFDYERDVIQRGANMARKFRKLLKSGGVIRVGINRRAAKHNGGRKWRNGATVAIVLGLQNDFFVRVRPDGYKGQLVYHPSFLDILK